MWQWIAHARARLRAFHMAQAPRCRAIGAWASAWAWARRARRHGGVRPSATGGAKGRGSPEPSRVDPNAGVSVRRQIQRAKRAKQEADEPSKPAKPAPRTKFRQTKERVRQRAVAEAERTAELLDGTAPSTMPRRRLGQTRLFVVDAYNVVGCGSWPRMKRLFRSGRIDEARELLLDELAFFTEERILAVFDAARVASSAPEQFAMGSCLTAVYAFDADEYIDREVCSLVQSDDLDVWVVTSDNLTRSIAATSGAQLMGAKDFVRYVKECKAAYAKDLKKLDAADAVASTLKAALSKETVSKLYTMRNKVRSHRMTKPEQNAGNAGAGGRAGEAASVGGGNGGGEPKVRTTREIRVKRKRKKAWKTTDLGAKAENPSAFSASGKLAAMRKSLAPHDDPGAEDQTCGDGGDG